MAYIAKHAVNVFNGPLLELGSGSGYWASLLRRNGVWLRPVDLMNGEYSPVQMHVDDTIQMDALDAVLSFHFGSVLMVWPTAGRRSWFGQVLPCLKSQMDVFVVVADPEDLVSEYPTVGSPEGFRFLAEKGELVGRLPLPHWQGLDDHLFHWRLK